MEEIRTGGIKEYFYSVTWAMAILFVGKFLIYLMPSYKLFGGIAAVVMFVILGFYVMTRYSAVFTYKLTGYVLRTERRIGGRTKEVELKISDIKSISYKKTGKFRRRDMYVMCATVFSFGKKRCYIEYTVGKENMLLIIEPSAEMAEKIKTLMRSVKND